MKKIVSVLSCLIVTTSLLLFSYHSRIDASTNVSGSAKIEKVNVYGDSHQFKLSNDSLDKLIVTPKVQVGEREVVSLTVSDLDITYKDIYSEEDIVILQQITEAECTGQSNESKQNVASVIINRVKSKEFPNTIKDVVFQTEPSVQFSPIQDGRFFEVEITKETIKAVEEVLANGVTNKALFFANESDIESLQTQRWFKNLNFLFSDSSGHSFYNDKE